MRFVPFVYARLNRWLHALPKCFILSLFVPSPCNVYLVGSTKSPDANRFERWEAGTTERIHVTKR